LALSAIGPDEGACSALEQAALRGRERNAFEVASRAFERSAQLAPRQEHQARLLYQAASTALQAGQGKRTTDLLEKAERCSCDAGLDIAIGHLRGYVAMRLGPVFEGLKVLLAAAKRASQNDPEEAAVMLAGAVNAAFYAGDADAMRSIAAEIAVIEPHLQADRTRFFATMAQRMALVFSGNNEKGPTLLRQAVSHALQVAHEVDDPYWLTWAAMGPIWLRERGAESALISRANDVARSRAAIGLLPYLLSHVAIYHAATSRWAEAEAAFYEVLELSEETNQRTDRAATLARLAWLEARQGKEGPCLGHAQEAIALADELGLRLCHIWALAALGELHLACGRTASAMESFQQQEALLEAARIGDVDLSPAPELVELHLRCGTFQVAARLAAAYRDKAVAKGQPWALARALRCQALLAGEGKVDQLFSEALEAHAQSPDAFEAARTRLAYGSRLRRSRQRVRAREQLQAAVEIFDDLGATPWSATARNELAATGVTARQRNDSTRYQMTPQELQVALLLASQQTTKQAAAALFLSPKTVEYHLRNIYRKLGCNTREELAGVLAADRALTTAAPRGAARADSGL
jgi:DNA-binding CsgD family transcriptional regulator